MTISKDLKKFMPSSPAEAERRLLHLEKERSRRKLINFVKYAWPLLEPAHPLVCHFALDAVCDHLQAVTEGHIKRLIINVPPGMAKSSIVAVLWPIWEWTFRPSLRWLFATYASKLTYRDARRRREIIKSNWYAERWGSSYSLIEEGVEFLKNEKQGHMFSTSADAQTTGWRCDRLVLDDPQDPKGAESEVQRESTIEWLRRTLPSRIDQGPHAARVLVQQRLHERDATGLYLDLSKEWVHLKIPLEFSGKTFSTPFYKDPRKVVGQVIDATLYPPKETEELKKTLGPYGTAGQLQQEPAPLEGGIIKRSWFNPYTMLDDGRISMMNGLYQYDWKRHFRFCVVDLATSTKEIGAHGKGQKSDPDYTVMMANSLFNATQGPVVSVLHILRDRLEGPDILPKLVALHREYKFHVIGVESVGFQLSFFQSAKRYGLPVREISTSDKDEVIYRLDRDKTARLIAATPLLADGRFWVPQYAPWLEDFIRELTTFPNAAHDDQCDVVAAACAIAEEYRGWAPSPVEPKDRSRSEDNPDRSRQDVPKDPLGYYYGERPRGF